MSLPHALVHPTFRIATLIGAALVACACATAPPAAPRTAAMPFEQKLAWIFQLEDQRVLRVPEPAPPPVAPAAKGRKPAPASVASTMPDLGRLLTDSEARVRRRAAIAVGRVRLREGLQLLMPLLADADPDVRQAAAFALGLIGDRSAAPALLPLLLDANPMLRGRAAEALGVIGADDAAADIGKVAAEYARSAPVAAMAPDDERWPAEPEAEAFKLAIFALVRLRAYEPLAAAVLQDGRPVSGWWPVAYALQRINDPRAAPALRELTRVKGRYTPAFAARGLGEIKDATAGDVLLRLLDLAATPREAAVAAIRAVARLELRNAAAPLGSIVADDKADPNLRLEAVTALGALRAADQLPLIQDQITAEWPAMRAAALRAAAVVDPETFIVTLSGLETDRHWTVRAALVEVLATLPADIALERVTAAMKDEDRRVIPAVLRALVRLKAPGAGKEVLAHLKDPDYVIRGAAAALVKELKPEGGLAALREAYEVGQPDAAYGARAAAIDAMSAYGTDAVEAIRAGLGDKDWAVRIKAFDVLTKIDPSSDHGLAIRPVPGNPRVAYNDRLLAGPPYSPHAFIETAKGTIEFELAVLDAPQTTRNFIALARSGFFNGLQVHRVVANFVVQDGDPRGDGEGGPGYTIRDEINERPYLRGAVGMALAWRDTGGSQFFITHSPHPHLDGLYTVFGHVVNGMDVLDRIQVGDVIQRVRVWDGASWE